MSRRAALAVALLLAVVAPRPSHAADPIPLWNGKDLSNWTFFLVDPKAKMEDTWSVRDGMIVCKGAPVGTLVTKEKYTSFRLLVEWRWAPGTVVTPEKTPNSGVLLRINGEMKQIPRSIESQLRSGDAGDLYGFWGMKIAGDPVRARREAGNPVLGDMTGVKKALGAENPVGEWNRYEIVLDGQKLDVSVNGKKVNWATVEDVIAGSIGLQSEGGEIHFRKVELQPLP
jgi:3-keto-disaccharide hydrolase